MRHQILENGTFSQLAQFGTWDCGPSPAEYAARVRRYRDEIGGLLFAAPQDWMAEPAIRAKTSLTVAQHQVRTVTNFLELQTIAPDVPWIPVLQGWSLRDYLTCTARYADAGVDLSAQRAVAIGSICRRQGSNLVADIIAAVYDAVPGIRIHALGAKIAGVAKYGTCLSSSDSLAWSRAARWQPPLPGCLHKSCANCMRFALKWRLRVIESLHDSQDNQL